MAANMDKTVEKTVPTKEAAKLAAKLFTPDTVDVWFAFGDDNQRVAAHKTLLAAMSPAFELLFNGTSRWNEANAIPITAIAHDVFGDFIRYFYTYEVRLDDRNVAAMFGVARAYGMVHVERLCAAYLLEHVTAANLFDVLGLASQYGFDANQGKCKAVISANVAAIMADVRFNGCDSKALATILQNAPVSCTPETIFDACVQWARNACERRNVDATNANVLREQLADCFHLIPFSRMCKQAFIDRVKCYGDLFKATDVVGILSAMEEPADNATLGPFKQQYVYNFPFSREQRESFGVNESCRIRFSLSRLAFFNGFSYAASNMYSDECKVSLSTIKHSGESVPQPITCYAICVSKNGYAKRYQFSKPNIIQPDVVYEILVCCPSMCGTALFRAISQKAVDSASLRIHDFVDASKDGVYQTRFVGLQFEQCKY